MTATEFLNAIDRLRPLLRLIAKRRVVGPALRYGDPEDAMADAIAWAWELQVTDMKKIRNRIVTVSRKMGRKGNLAPEYLPEQYEGGVYVA